MQLRPTRATRTYTLFPVTTLFRSLPTEAERSWWYQFYFATDRGQRGYEANRGDFAKLIWQSASPEWRFDDATFERSAQAFDNPDHVAIVIHNYRWRLGLAADRKSTRLNSSN